MKGLIAQLCLTISVPMDYSPPGSSVHGILQARILEWVAICFSLESSLPRDQTPLVCIADRLQADSLPSEPPGKLIENIPILKLRKYYQGIAGSEES